MEQLTGDLYIPWPRSPLRVIPDLLYSWKSLLSLYQDGQEIFSLTTLYVVLFCK